MTIPEGLAKRLVLEKRETWFPYGIMIADNSPAIRAAVEAERAIAARQTCPACGRIHECPRGFSSEPAPENAAAILEAVEAERAKVVSYLGDCQLMIADISLTIRAAVEAEREECLHILWRMARECREANPDMERALLRAAEKIVIRARGY